MRDRQKNRMEDPSPKHLVLKYHQGCSPDEKSIGANQAFSQDLKTGRLVSLTSCLRHDPPRGGVWGHAPRENFFKK